MFDTRIYYQYDAMNRLLEESYYENEAEETMQYEYDFCGNRLSKKQWKKEEKIEPIFKEEKSWYNTKNQLIKRQSENETIFYTYDKQGNTIQESGGEVDWTYSYNPFGQQIRSENTNGYFQENFYDGEYLRAGVNKNGSSSKFLYYRGELLSEITKKQGERKGNRLILGYGVVASEELGLQNHRQEHKNHNFHTKTDRRTIGFYHFDEQNSTAFITGNNQEIQNAYTYDAFGNIRNQKETLHNRILYTGQQYDRESNQYYLRARYYNPTLGRFTQEDVYRGDGLNLYDYCKGNPVVWYDPSGYIIFYSTYEERINVTRTGIPDPKTNERKGCWINEDGSEGVRGESKYIAYDHSPRATEANRILREKGLDGIKYSHGVPNFRPASEYVLEIDEMVEYRQKTGGIDGNYERADKKFAEELKREENRQHPLHQKILSEHGDINEKIVKKYRENNNLTWHEENDLKTMNLVANEINGEFKHLGGVSETKKKNAGIKCHDE